MIDPDTEKWQLQLMLVQGHAENVRLDAGELLDAGFEVVQVRGLDGVLWQHPDGLLDGALFTTEAALAEVRPTIEEPEEGQP